MRKIEENQIMPKKTKRMKKKRTINNPRLAMRSLRLLPLQAIVMTLP